ncbi:MAG: hypothetical protein ACAI44_40910, partial [Candidatus Sericytochromatia bacterium]
MIRHSIKRHSKFWLAGLAAVATLTALPAQAEDPTYSYPDQRFRFSDPNPAGFSFYGTGRLQLPSVRADIGSSLQIDKITRDFSTISVSFNDLIAQLDQGDSEVSTEADALKLRLEGFLEQFEKHTRADYEFDISLAGFGGSPLAMIQLGNKPLALGLHVGSETRGFIDARFSDQFNKSLVALTAQLPDVFATGSRVAQISSQAGSVIQQVNALTADIDNLANRASDFFNNPSQQELNQLLTVLGEVDDEVDALLPTARALTGVVSSTSSGARNLLGAVKNASGGGIQLTAANDLHLTLGVGGSYPVFENDQFKISVGAQAKLFMVPVTVPVRNLQIDSDAGLLGKLEVSEVGGLTDTGNLDATLDSFDKAVASVNTTIDAAEKLSADVDKVTTAVDVKDFSQIASSGSSLVADGLAFNNSIGAATTNVQQAAVSINNIQRTLINQLSGVNAKGTLTTPDSAGFGLDLGVDAVLWRHLRLG